MDIGKIWNGWEIEKLIGEGSFGKVYKIVRKDFGHTYVAALKVIQIPQSLAELDTIRHESMSEESVTTYYMSMVEEIVEEFVLMSKLKGITNIVSYEDHAVVPMENSFGWEIYIRMELLSPLFEYIEKHTFDTKEIVQMGIDICTALEVCQEYNIIHRDIKPENIFVSDLGKFKLGDFGIARQMEKTSSGMSKKGTFSYMAPEVYKGLNYTHTVDIYSLGIVLYRFLNKGRTPFLPDYPTPIKYSDKDNANVARMNGKDMPRPIDADERLSKIILKACSFISDDRYQSAGDLKKDLEEYLKSVEIDKQTPYINTNPMINAENTYDETIVLDDYEARPVIPNEPEKKGVVSNDLNNKKENKQKDKLKLKFSNKNIKYIGLIVGLLVVVVLGFIFMNQSSKNTVPDLHNLDVDKARELLKADDLELKIIDSKSSDDILSNEIISQNIKPGENVNNGTVIEVVVSTGPKITIPNIKNLSVIEATKKMEDLGLKVKIKKTTFSLKVKKDYIINQYIKEGQKVDRGSEIEVEVSKGAERTKVPNVKNMSEDDAINKLKSSKLKYSIQREYSDSISKGKVISQSVSSGKEVNIETQITITISRGKKPSDSKPKSKSKPKKKEENWQSVDWQEVN